MKLHTDGTIEGTPEEVAAYKRAYADGVEAKLVTEGRIKPTEHNYQILEREARPDYAQQQSGTVNLLSYQKAYPFGEWQTVKERLNVTVGFNFPVKWLERYSIDALRNEIARRKKIAEESGQLL